MKCFFIGFVKLLLLSALIGEQPPLPYSISYYNFSKVDGFTDNVTYQVIQDKQGFIYACMATGFYMHNGNKWVYLKSPLDNHERNLASLLNLMAYNPKDNILYLISTNDFQLYFPADGKFLRIDTDIMNEGIKDAHYENGVGLLILTKKNIYQLNNNKIEMWPIQINKPELVSKIYDVFDISEQWLGLSALDNLFLYDKKNKKTHIFRNNTGYYNYQGVFDKKRNRIWFQSVPYLIYFDIDKKTFHTEYKSKITSGECRTIHLADNDILWISSGSFYNINDQKWTNIPYQDGKYTNAVQYWPKIFRDREGNQWHTSLGYGMNVIFHPNKYVKNFNITYNELSVEPVIVIEINREIYITNGVSKEINVFDKDEEIFRKYTVNSNGPSYGFSKSHKNIYYTDGYGIWSIQTDSKKSNEIYLPDSIKNVINPILYTQYANGRLIFGNTEWTGFVEDSKFKLNPVFDNDKIGSFQKSYLDTIDDKLYILGSSNIGYINLNDFTSHILTSSGNFNINAPTSLVRIKNKLWITSKSDGLISYDLQTSALKFFNTENSLFVVNFFAYGIKDGQKLWLGSSDALYLFDTESENIIGKYDRQNGFSRDDAGYNLLVDDKNLYKFNFGSLDMMNRKALKVSTFKGPIFITSIEKENFNVLSVPLDKDTCIEISETQIFPKIEFSVPVYANYNKHKFSFRILELDTLWKDTYERYISPGKLPSGRYNIEIKCTLSDGTLLSEVRKIEVRVKPLFYKTWWFLLLLVSFFTGLAYYLYRSKISKLKDEFLIKSSYEKQLASLEMKALRAQMNPHFIFNTLNSIQKFIFENDAYAASQYLTKFSRLIRLILDQSNQDYITIGSEIEMLNYYVDMEKLRFSNQFNFTLYKDQDIHEEWLIPSMVIQPHIENSIWHGLMHLDRQGNLTIKFLLRPNESKYIVIEIMDDGIGRAKAEQLKSKQLLKNKSYGSRLSEERIRHFNKMNNVYEDLIYEDLVHKGAASGTKVIIKLHYKTKNDQ